MFSYPLPPPAGLCLNTPDTKPRPACVVVVTSGGTEVALAPRCVQCLPVVAHVVLIHVLHRTCIRPGQAWHPRSRTLSSLPDLERGRTLHLKLPTQGQGPEEASNSRQRKEISAS